MDTQHNEGKTETIGSIIKESILSNGVDMGIFEQELNMPTGTLEKIMNDECFVNSIPVKLFAKLLFDLDIHFDKIEPVILPTFNLIKSKETPETIREKPFAYGLWENKESIIKYTQRLKEICSNLQKPPTTPTPVSRTAEEIIKYIENDSGILIPVERFFNEDGTHITQKKYGLILLEILCQELREKFAIGTQPEERKEISGEKGCPFDEQLP